MVTGARRGCEALGVKSDRVTVTARNPLMWQARSAAGRARGYCACNPRHDEFG